MPKTPLEREIIQDFTQIKDVGNTFQQNAGHIFRHANGGYNEPGSAWSDLLAYYKFGSGDLVGDEKGSYDLTNNNTVINANGIMGSDYAAEFNGSNQYFSQGTLLDSTSSLSNGIAIDFWFKADDGQPAAYQRFFYKVNVSGSDHMIVELETTGQISLNTRESGNTINELLSSTILPNGITDWYYICVTWDSINGKRLWVNGVLEGQDSNETAIMGNGTFSNFAIGASDTTTDLFDGKIAQFRVRDQILTQKDVDLAYATEYPVPSSFSAIDEYSIIAHAKEDGSDDFESQVSWGGMEVARNENYIYRYGAEFRSNDELKLEIRR